MSAAIQRYRLPAIALHWLIALLIIALLGLGYYMVDIPRGTPERAYYFNLHKSLGIIAIAATAMQLVWHLTHAVPALPDTMSPLEIKATLWGHRILYVLMVVVPLTGYLSSSFSKYGVHIFGLELPHWGWEDMALRDIWVTAHGITSMVLIALVVVHVLAALKHALLDRDRVLQRMLP